MFPSIGDNDDPGLFEKIGGQLESLKICGYLSENTMNEIGNIEEYCRKLQKIFIIVKKDEEKEA